LSEEGGQKQQTELGSSQQQEGRPEIKKEKETYLAMPSYRGKPNFCDRISKGWRRRENILESRPGGNAKEAN